MPGVGGNLWTQLLTMKEWSVTVARLGLKEGAIVCPLPGEEPGQCHSGEVSVVFSPTVATAVLARVGGLWEGQSF